MAQRDSGYERKARDAYMTPAWVTAALVADLERCGYLPVCTASGSATEPSQELPLAIWEPAAGTGQMADALVRAGYDVFCSDIAPEPGVVSHDFITRDPPMLMPAIGAIFTNPPYSHAEEFVDKALALMEPVGGLVAMLLKVDWDSAKTRRRFFADNPAWVRKLVLLDRIHWFDPPPRQKGEKANAGPSENHAWYVWSFARRHVGYGLGASIGYISAPEEVLVEIREKRKAVAA